VASISKIPDDGNSDGFPALN